MLSGLSPNGEPARLLGDPIGEVSSLSVVAVSVLVVVSSPVTSPAKLTRKEPRRLSVQGSAPGSEACRAAQQHSAAPQITHADADGMQDTLASSNCFMEGMRFTAFKLRPLLAGVD